MPINPVAMAQGRRISRDDPPHGFNNSKQRKMRWNVRLSRTKMAQSLWITASDWHHINGQLTSLALVRCIFLGRPSGPPMFPDLSARDRRGPSNAGEICHGRSLRSSSTLGRAPRMNGAARPSPSASMSCNPQCSERQVVTKIQRDMQVFDELDFHEHRRQSRRFLVVKLTKERIERCTVAENQQVPTRHDGFRE